MKNLLLIIAIFSMSACAKKASPVVNNANPLYISQTSVISGVESPCEACLTLETSGVAIRVSFSNNPLEECAGAGNGTYNSNNPFTPPTDVQVQTDYTGQLLGSSSNDINCFPTTLTLQMDYQNASTFYMSYQGRSYLMKKN